MSTILPTDICLHSTTLHPLPRVTVIMIGTVGPMQRSQDGIGYFPTKDKTHAIIRRAIVIVLHRISKAACFAHQWERTVAHSDHLTNATRLKVTRHQKDIATGINPLSKCSIVALKDFGFLRVSLT